MNQKNIFGYVHYTSELLQQFEFITGLKAASRRVRPYMNIPAAWRDPPLQQGDLAEKLGELFEATDIFVVEVSSVRKLRFKSAFLQINRVRELLVDGEDALRQWWNPLVREGDNRAIELGLKWPTPVQAEVAAAVWSGEQTRDEVIADLLRIKELLRKPVLFVSHFNTDYQRASIEQRKIIIDAMSVAAREEGCYFFDPTPEVLSAGLPNAIQDLGHYKPSFEPFIAQRLSDRVRAILGPWRAAGTQISVEAVPVL